MKDSRADARALLEKLTRERDVIDRTIAALRPLVAEEVTEPEDATENATNGGHTELANGGHNEARHSNGHTNDTELTGGLARVVKTLRQLREPMSAANIRRAMGRNAPPNAELFRLLNKAMSLGAATRTGNRGTYKYAAQSLQ